MNVTRPLVGIILTAGNGTRLGPLTGGLMGTGTGISKGLNRIYDKPNIYYPLADMISVGIQEVLIITAQNDLHQYRAMLGDGSKYGIRIAYAVQKEQNGIASAFVIGEAFIGMRDVCLMFADNVFIGDEFINCIKPTGPIDGAQVFAVEVPNPCDFGVVEFDANGTVRSIEEKPAHPKSNFAVPGLYFYDSSVVEIAKQVQPSDRGELEISSVNEAYLARGKLAARKIDPTVTWMDTGTIEAILELEPLIRDYQRETGRLFGSPEIATFETGRISSDQLWQLAEEKHLAKSEYGEMLRNYCLKFAFH